MVVTHFNNHYKNCTKHNTSFSSVKKIFSTFNTVHIKLLNMPLKSIDPQRPLVLFDKFDLPKFKTHLPSIIIGSKFPSKSSRTSVSSKADNSEFFKTIQNQNTIGLLCTFMLQIISMSTKYKIIQWFT